jgi:hypothetical protein
MPFLTAARRFGGLWLAAAPPDQIEGDLDRHVNAVDGAEVTIRLVGTAGV